MSEKDIINLDMKSLGMTSRRMLAEVFYKEVTKQCALYKHLMEDMSPLPPKTDLEKWRDVQEEYAIRRSKEIYDWSYLEDQ